MRPYVYMTINIQIEPIHFRLKQKKNINNKTNKLLYSTRKLQHKYFKPMYLL